MLSSVAAEGRLLPDNLATLMALSYQTFPVGDAAIIERRRAHLKRLEGAGAAFVRRAPDAAAFRDAYTLLYNLVPAEVG